MYNKLGFNDGITAWNHLRDLLIDGFIAFEIVYDRKQKRTKYARNGPSILITKVAVIKNGKLYGGKVCGYKMNDIDSLDVDSSNDFDMIKMVMEKRCLVK